MLRSMLWMVAAAVLTAVSAARATVDTFTPRLDDAIEKYAKTHPELRRRVLDALAPLLAEAKAAGDATRVQQLEFERRAFESNEAVYPPSVPDEDIAAFQRDLRSAVNKLTREYEAAIIELKKRSQPELADKAETHLKQLRDQSEFLAWTDLRSRADLLDKSVKGEWLWKGPGLQGGGPEQASLAIPAILPKAYVLRLKATRVSGTGSLQLAIRTSQQARLALVLDSNTQTSGLERLDGKDFDKNDSRYQGELFALGAPTEIEVTVAPDGIKVTAGERSIITWTGEAKQITTPSVFAKFEGLPLVVGSETVFRIDDLKFKEIKPAPRAKKPTENRGTANRDRNSGPDPMPKGAKWSGSWSGRDGNSAHVEVVDRPSRDSAVFRITFESGGHLRVSCSTSGTEIQVEDVEHKGPNGHNLVTRAVERTTGTADARSFVLPFHFKWDARTKNQPFNATVSASRK